MEFKLDPPVGKEQSLFDAWLNDQLRKFQDGLANHQDERKGVAAVTGTAIVPTGLKVVQFCHASFYDDTSVAAMALSVRPDVTAGAIRIVVKAWGNTWSPTLIASTTPTNVNWVAYGF